MMHHKVIVVIALKKSNCGNFFKGVTVVIVNLRFYVLIIRKKNDNKF